MASLSEGLTRLEEISRRESELIVERQRVAWQRLGLALNESQKAALDSINNDIARWERAVLRSLRLAILWAAGTAILGCLALYGAGWMMGSWAADNLREWRSQRERLVAMIAVLEEKKALAAATWRDPKSGRVVVRIEPNSVYRDDRQRAWAHLALVKEEE